MKNWTDSFYAAFWGGLLFFSCESKPAESVKQPTPQVFTPSTETEAPTNAITDSLEAADGAVAVPDPVEVAAEKEPEQPVVERKPMPTVAELKKITPSQEAKRALSNDAMQIFRMQPEAFFKYMQGRIPYYRGKGNLKAENDMLRLEITDKEMIIETPKGRRTFSME